MDNRQNLKADLIISIQITDLILFKNQVIKSLQYLPSLTDAKGYNVLHDICASTQSEKDLLPFISFLLDSVTLQHPNLLSTILDTQTLDDSSTPLLFSIKYNKPKIFKLLIKFGVNLNLKNNYDRGPLHTAAACGRIGMFVELLEKGLDIDEKDAHGRAPLHIAALEGQDQMCLAIIAWTKNLSQPDNESYTPLHLATLSQSYKIVRHLLINNAEISIQDKHGQTAYDIANAKGNESIIKLLVINIQQKPGYLELFNPCKVQLKPIKKSVKHPVLFLLFTFIRYALVIIFIWPRIDLFMAIGSFSTVIITGFLFVYISIKDPGYIPRTLSFPELYETYKPEFVCPYCRVFKERNARHCQHCQKCVRDFDHHCPWIHNCVGSNNHKAFIIFLTICWLDFAYHLFLGLLDFLGILNKPKNILYKFPIAQENSSLALCILCFFGFLLVFPLWVTQIRNWCYNKALNKKFASKNGTNWELVDPKALLGSESEGWLSKIPSEILVDEPTETSCYFKNTKKVRVNPDINNTTFPS